MKYADWKKAFVDSREKLGLTLVIAAAIIKPISSKDGGSGVQTVGYIDIEKYRCITDDITTDEVIITPERIQHIKNHHPGHFELIEPFLKDVLEAPQYILEDAPNTGLILKMIERQGINIKVVLRIHTSSDPAGFKNSIISAWHIRDKEYKRLIRNKRILYKQE